MARRHFVDCPEHFVVGDYGIEVRRIWALYGVLTHLLNLLLEELQLVHVCKILIRGNRSVASGGFVFHHRLQIAATLPQRL